MKDNFNEDLSEEFCKVLEKDMEYYAQDKETIELISAYRFCFAFKEIMRLYRKDDALEGHVLKSVPDFLIRNGFTMREFQNTDLARSIFSKFRDSLPTKVEIQEIANDPGALANYIATESLGLVPEEDGSKIISMMPKLFPRAVVPFSPTSSEMAFDCFSQIYLILSKEEALSKMEEILGHEVDKDEKDLVALIEDTTGVKTVIKGE